MNIHNKKGRKFLIVVILVLLFSLALRMDFSNTYPKGADTYELYSLSKNIQQKEYVVWNIDFLTAIGMTSVSYPPGGIIFLSEISTVSGLDIKNSIFIWNFFLIITCSLLIFMISRTIFKNDYISIIAVLIYLNTRFFISYSTYFTTRNIIHVFFLSILLILLKENINIKKLTTLLILIIASLLTHRSAILIIIFLLSYIFSIIIYKYYKNTTINKILIILLGASMFLISIYFFGHTSIGTETSKIPFEVGISYIDDIFSIIFSLGMHFGLLLIFTIPGYIVLINKKEKKRKDFFILTIITLSAAFLIETIYFFYLFMPILVILTSYFLEYITSKKIKYLNRIIIFLIISALMVPLYITITESKSDLTYVRAQTLKTISYLENENVEKSVVCNNHAIYCSHIYALSDNITALTYTSVRTMMDRITVKKTSLIWWRVRSKIIVEDNILGTSLFADSYASAITKWNLPKPTLDKLLEFTNLGYIIDSTNSDSIRNRPRMQEKFPYTDQVYNNGLQQVQVIV